MDLKTLKNWQIFVAMAIANLIYLYASWLFGGIILAIVAVMAILWIKDKQPKTVWDIIVTVLAVLNGAGAVIFMLS